MNTFHSFMQLLEQFCNFAKNILQICSAKQINFGFVYEFSKLNTLSHIEFADFFHSVSCKEN